MKRQTRIQREKTEAILEAALDVFSAHGFRGATLDQIAEAAGLSKPNVLYYFESKEAIHTALLSRQLETWLDPLRALDAAGDPLEEIARYIRRKVAMSRDYPRESRIFASEILHGAPHILPQIEGPLRALVDQKAAVIRQWAEEGRIAPLDPHHLIFSIWATTQHYADFDVQVRAVMGSDSADRFTSASKFLESLYLGGIRPTQDQTVT